MTLKQRFTKKKHSNSVLVIQSLHTHTKKKKNKKNKKNKNKMDEITNKIKKKTSQNTTKNN